ncbi:MAG: hypothetical protein K5768_10210 [Firmicutes bacterium]|nr:hypothetical protein [Bacillota bacterium]
MVFYNVPKEYRPIPFWSWNEKLNTDETVRQVQVMDKAGIGGFFMHARGGLRTEYMGDEWFSNISAAKNEAKKRGMSAWAYDENGWPSGFGDGKVNGLGIEYQQKYLRMSDTEPTENVIAKSGNHCFYFDVNPFYVDTLDKKVIQKFIEVTYEPYYEKYKNEIEGFFTDEPQISRNGIPWSFVFEDEYQTRYNENILEHLEELFLPVCDYKNTRVKFWKMVTDLFSSAFCKQIYDWCDARDLKFTGHLVEEENLQIQLTTNGACMPHYEYFHMPGMDWLGRPVFDCLTPKQVSSVAEQLGKDRVLSETFALCGHNVSFAELKGIYEWQMIHGINMLCQHLEGYSIRGIRKRDYPPAMYCQQPWWSEYDKFVNAMSREGMILSKGEKKADVLLIHPMTTAWTMFDNGKNEGIDELNKKFLSVIKDLEQKHILFHLGDETIMERHAKVVGNKLVIGKQSYTYVLNPCGEIFLSNTEKLLNEFTQNGGKLNCKIPENNMIDNSEITYTKRDFDGFCMHYFVNTSKDRKTAKVNVNGKKLDIYTGELSEFCGTHEFEPWGSLMIIEDGTKNTENTEKEPTFILIENDLKIKKPIQNVLTLDRCDYYFDGVLQEKNGYVLNIAERANLLERKVKIHQDYKVKINDIPNELYLICETPQKFEIKVNDKTIEEKPNGYFLDKSFEKIDISKYIKTGENIISFDCDFVQSDKFYENLKKAQVFESEKNKLCYNMEIEAIYLLGDFAVKTDGKWEKLDKDAVRYSGDFALEKQKPTLKPQNIEQQGYPFFAGEMTLETELDIEGKNPILSLDIKGINAVKVKIGDTEKVMLTDNRLPLCDFGAGGRVKAEITLINNLRNMLGPHHLKEGESYFVGPWCFFKEKCIWADNPEKDWDDNYCFIQIAI